MTEEIRVYDAPDVAIVASTRVDEPKLDQWIERQGFDDGDLGGWDRLRGGIEASGLSHADVLVEGAARVCYMSYNLGRGHAEHIENLRAQGHTSTFEHPSFTLAIAGVSRGLTHELARHRVGVAISQLSQRYCGPEHVAFVIPPAYLPSYRAWLALESYREADAIGSSRGREEALDAAEAMTGHRAMIPVAEEARLYGAWLAGRKDDLAEYRETLDYLREETPEARRQEIYEAARSCLPNCTETKLFWTLNARSARHALAMRGSPHADAEFRRLALAIAGLLKAHAPQLFADLSTDGGVVEFGGGR